jgi:hypothetical protein
LLWDSSSRSSLRWPCSGRCSAGCPHGRAGRARTTSTPRTAATRTRLARGATRRACRRRSPCSRTFIHVETTCDVGAGNNTDEIGHYSVDIYGTSTESCATGLWGAATLSAQGPEAFGSGNIQFHRAGIHYYMYGQYFDDAGDAHIVWLWLDMTDPPCPNSFRGNLIGHGVFFDWN